MRLRFSHLVDVLGAGPGEAAGVVAADDVERGAVGRRPRREHHRHQRLPLRRQVVRRLQGHALRRLEQHQRRGVRPVHDGGAEVDFSDFLMPVLLMNRCSPACDGGHEGRIAAGVLRRQQRLQVRPEDGAVANQLQRGQRGGAAPVRLGQGVRLRSLVRFRTCEEQKKISMSFADLG